MMGAAYQAKHGLLRDNCSFQEITHCLPELTLVCQPYDDAEFVSKKKIDFCIFFITVTDVLINIS